MNRVHLHCERRCYQLIEGIDHYLMVSVDVLVTNKSKRREQICLIHSETAAGQRTTAE